MQQNILPLDINQFSFDTRGLTAEQCGVYIRLLTHFQQFGPLPNDMNYVASLVGLRGDAPSILKECLARVFYVGNDGRLDSRQWGFRFRSEKDKAKKRKERARHAANSRWDRVRECRRMQGEGQMTCSEHGETENFPPSPPPPLSPPTPLSITPSLSSTRGGRIPPSNPPSEAREPEPVAQVPPDPPPGAAVEAGETSQERENKAKTLPSGFRALRRRHNEGNPHPEIESGVKQAQRVRNRHSGLNGQPEIAPALEDVRFEPCRDLVFGYWAKGNKNLKSCPWGAGERRALRDLLAANPSITVEHFERCLSNRALSRVNPATLPASWLRTVMEFGAVPLNEYGSPFKVTPIQAGVYKAPATEEEAKEKERINIAEICKVYLSTPSLRADIKKSWKAEWGRGPWEDEA